MSAINPASMPLVPATSGDSSSESVAAMLSSAWMVQNKASDGTSYNGDFLRDAYGKNLAVSNDPRIAAMLTIARVRQQPHSGDELSGDAIRGAYLVMLAHVHDPMATATITMAWADQASPSNTWQQPSDAMEAYDRNFSATQDPTAAAILTAAWLQQPAGQFTSGDDMRGNYQKNLDAVRSLGPGGSASPGTTSPGDDPNADPYADPNYDPYGDTGDGSYTDPMFADPQIPGADIPN